MRVALVVALIVVALSGYAWFVRPLDGAELAHAEASETSWSLPVAGATDCAAPSPFDDRDQTRASWTD